MISILADSGAELATASRRQIVYKAQGVETPAWLIPYQGIIEPNSTIVLPVLRKADSGNNELGQETSAR